MGRKKKNDATNLPVLTATEISETQTALTNILDTDPRFSLEVDPENKYNMTEPQKEFVRHYVNFKSIPTAAEFAHIDMDHALEYYVAYSSQQEIRRINLALYQRQFQQKLLDLDQIGGYLTSLITGDGVPLADQLKPVDKLKVVDMLIDLNKLKSTSLQEPGVLMNSDIEVEISKLSIKTIASLLDQSKHSTSKVIDAADDIDGLTPEEKVYLTSLPSKDLLDIIEQTQLKN